MPGINDDMHYLTEYTLSVFSIYYYYCQTYIAPYSNLAREFVRITAPIL